MSQENTHIDNLIARYLAGETTHEEWLELSSWMENSPENQKYFEGIKFVHDKAVASHRIVKVDTDKAWSKLSSQMAKLETAETVKTIELPLYKKAWFRTAAVIAVLIGVASLLYFMGLPSGGRISPVTIAATDSVITKTLADNTRITVNKNSKASFRIVKRRREIDLSGEAFIQVSHSVDTPLVVKAGETLIRDIGTAFNVKAYPDGQFVEVYVESGEVNFYTENSSGITLKAGESGSYDKLKKVFLKPDAVDVNVVAYKSKFFVFHDVTLNKVLAALNNVYGQVIELENPKLGNCSITVTFDNENPASIADIIAETLNFRVIVSGNKYILQGDVCPTQP